MISVCLAEVYEQSFVACLRLAWSACAVAALAAFGVAVAAALCAVAGGFEYLRCVGVVFEESSELQAHDFLQYVFLVYELEVAVYVVHEGCYLLLVNVCLLYLVYRLVELFGAYLLRCGQCAVDEVFAYLALYVAHLTLLACVYDAYRRALLAGAACSS